jgi:hypothetical protein
MKFTLRPVRWLMLMSCLFVVAVPCAYTAEATDDIEILAGRALQPDNEGGFVVVESGWAALVCKVSTCELRPIVVATDELEGRDPPPTTALQSLKLVEDEAVIAILRGLPDGTQHDVPTWFTEHTPRAPADEVNGSLGVTITADNGNAYHLMPRWNPQAAQLTFYLETKNQRQQLALFDIDYINVLEIKTTHVLKWAGDIDGDGRIDLITGNESSADLTAIHLWLSSHASQGQITGEIFSPY